MHLETFDRVGVVVIDRPHKRNAVDLDSLIDLGEAQVRASSIGCRVLLVRGAPPAFCSGADLDGVELGEFTDVLARVLRGFVDWPGMTVAFVDGPALGAGLQIAAACDMRIATPVSAFGIPAAKLGLAVDAWTVERLAREIGWSRARAMLLTGDPIMAAELAGGFVNQLIDAPTGDDAFAEVMETVTQWSARAPLTVVAHKLALESATGSEASVDTQGSNSAVTASDVEQARLAAWNSDDAIEGRAAFKERRPPNFQGR